MVHTSYCYDALTATGVTAVVCVDIGDVFGDLAVSGDLREVDLVLYRNRSGLEKSVLLRSLGSILDIDGMDG